jgi:hypothetical protein
MLGARAGGAGGVHGGRAACGRAPAAPSRASAAPRRAARPGGCLWGAAPGRRRAGAAARGRGGRAAVPGRGGRAAGRGRVLIDACGSGGLMPRRCQRAVVLFFSPRVRGGGAGVGARQSDGRAWAGRGRLGEAQLAPAPLLGPAGCLNGGRREGLGRFFWGGGEVTGGARAQAAARRRRRAAQGRQAVAPSAPFPPLVEAGLTLMESRRATRPASRVLGSITSSMAWMLGGGVGVGVGGWEARVGARGEQRRATVGSPAWPGRRARRARRPQWPSAPAPPAGVPPPRLCALT